MRFEKCLRIIDLKQVSYYYLGSMGPMGPMGPNMNFQLFVLALRQVVIDSLVDRRSQLAIETVSISL